MADKEIHHYRLTGLSCTNCSAKFEKNVQAALGVFAGKHDWHNPVDFEHL